MRLVVFTLGLLLASCSREAPKRSIEVVTAGLLEDGGRSFEVLREREDGSVRIGTISPAIHYSRDGAGMPTLILPPPADVRLKLDAAEFPAALNARAGVDISAMRFLQGAVESIRVRFELERNGSTVFETTIELALNETERVGSNWVDVDLAATDPLTERDEVILRTRVVDENGKELPAPVELLAGFGGLTLTQQVDVERQVGGNRPPNLLLVVMDTLRRDRLSTYGYDKATDPSLKSLAERGAVFEWAYSTASWTWPSTASVLTGMDPAAHGVVDKLACFLPYTLTTLAEELQQRGYRTAGWSGNPLVSDSRNFAQGFDSFTDVLEFTKTDHFFEEIAAWIEEGAGESSFLYLHLVEPHEPYVPLPSSRALFAPDVARNHEGTFSDPMRRLRLQRANNEEGADPLEDHFDVRAQEELSQLYDASVHSADEWLGRVLSKLEESGLLDDTVVIFTSDHGEELFDRGSIGHGQSIHREQVEVPFIVAGPGVPSGVRSPAIVSTQAIPALAMDLLGFRGQHSFTHVAPVDMRSSEVRVPRDDVYFGTKIGVLGGRSNLSMRGVRRGDSLLHEVTLPAEAGSDSEPTSLRFLYDKGTDPLELNPLDGASDSSGIALFQSLESHQQSESEKLIDLGGAQAGGSATEALLKRLGYL